MDRNYRGMGFCRFDCVPGELPPGTNVDHRITLDKGKGKYEFLLCGLWDHYASVHNVLPPETVRTAVMKADPAKAVIEERVYRNLNVIDRAYFVEKDRKSPGGYNHLIGNAPDTEFIDKMNGILRRGRRTRI
jgi:hypothetical protein